MNRYSMRGALLASTALLVLGSGQALAQAVGSCTTSDGDQVCQGDQPTADAYAFGLETFTNTGSLNSAFLYLYNSYTPFRFLNTETGVIISQDQPVPAVVIDGSNPNGVLDVESFINRGIIGSVVGPAVFAGSRVDIGSFENSGTIAATGEGHTPGGCFFAEDYGVEIQGRITGDFTNSGTISGTDTGVHLAWLDGDFDNTGTILASGGQEFGDTAVRLGTLGGDFINGAEGVISRYAAAVRIDEIGGSFLNFGSISGEREAISISWLDGSFINFNTIESTENHQYGATWIGHLGGLFGNAADARILSEDHGVWISTMAGSHFMNDGLISSRFTAVTIGQAESSYIFVNTGDILASDGSGIILGFGFGPGAERQISGAVRSHDFAGEVSFHNLGTIRGTDGGVVISDNVSDFSNTGSIEGGRSAVELGGATGFFFNSGEIIGGTYGVGGRNLTGNFSNYGLIRATGGIGGGVGQSALDGDAVPGLGFGFGVNFGLVQGSFLNRGDIIAPTMGVTIFSLGGDFTNERLIETLSTDGPGVPRNEGGDLPASPAAYAVSINSMGGSGDPFNAGPGSALAAEDVFFSNSEAGQIIGADGGVRIQNMMGSGFYNSGLISSGHHAVTIERAYSDYTFGNQGDILSSYGTGVSLGVRSGNPVIEPLQGAASRSTGEYAPDITIDFFNTGNIVAGRTGVEIGHDVSYFTNDGLISGSEYGVRLSGAVSVFANTGTITASGDQALPPNSQRMLDDDPGLSAPALGMAALGDAVSLEYVNGSFVNGESGGISGELRGVNAFVVEGAFLNQGSISGGYQGVSLYSLAGDFLNLGLISQTDAVDNSDAAAVSIVYFDGESGFYNAAGGEILSQSDGVVVREFLGGSFLNEGLISSRGNAVSLQFIGGERVFENSGDIISSEGSAVILSHYAGGGCGMGMPGADRSPCAGNPSGADAGLTDLIFVNTGSILSTVLGVRIEGLVSLFDNAGSITGGKVGVDLYGDVGTLSNHGAITGDQTGVRFNDDIELIYNAGSITGLTGGELGIGAGLRVYGGGGTQLVNVTSGVISGFTGVVLGDGADILRNAGILTGTGGVAASLGGGDDTFFSHGIGSISGAIDGGADFDTFLAYGSQTLDFAIDNFEAFWLDYGDFSFGRDHAGEYLLALGDSLDLAGFTFTGDVLNSSDLFADGGVIDGSAVNFGSILALDLTITGDLHNGGVINPGGTGALGTLTVLGDFYALNIGDPVDVPGEAGNARALSAAILSPSSSTLVFNFNGLNHDQIIVTGTASLGGDLLITGNLAQAMKAHQAFTLVSGASVTGNYNLLNLGGLLLTPQLGVVGNQVQLSFAVNNFVTSLNPATLNQAQAASGLQSRWTLGASAADDIVLALNAGAASAPILEAFAPETSAALTRQSARIGTQLAQTVANCTTGPNAAACGQRQSDGTTTVWVNVSGSGSRLRGDGNAASVTESFSQVSSGVEYALNDGFAAGIFLASGTGDVDIAQGGRGHGEIDSVAGGVYGRLQAGGLTLAGLVGQVDTDVEARRSTPSGLSIGETGGSVSFARLDARLTLVDGASQAGFTLSGSYAEAEIGNFAQRGAGGFDLDIIGEDFTVEDWEIRGFFGHDFELGQSGHLWSFGGTAGLVHAMGDDTGSAGASFPGDTTIYQALGPRSNDTGGVAGGFINLASPLIGVSAQLGLEGRWMEGEETSRVYGRFAWTF